MKINATLDRKEGERERSSKQNPTDPIYINYFNQFHKVIRKIRIGIRGDQLDEQIDSVKFQIGIDGFVTRGKKGIVDRCFYVPWEIAVYLRVIRAMFTTLPID